MSAHRLCSLLSCLTFISIHTALAQAPQYEGDDLRIVAISWDYTEARGVGPNGPWQAIPVNTGGNFTSDTTFYAFPSLSDTNILVDRAIFDLGLDDVKSSVDWPSDFGYWGALSSGWGTILGDDYDIVDFEGDSDDFASFGGRFHQYAGFAYDIAEQLSIGYKTMPFRFYNYTRSFQRIIASRNLTLQAPWGNDEPIMSSFLSLNASRNVSNILSYPDDSKFLNSACESDPTPMCDRYADENVSMATYNSTLANFVTNEVAASRSFALQIGSVTPFIEPTLLFGGYDANLFLTEPALINVSDPNGVTLQSLRLSVKSGDIAFQHPEDFQGGRWLRDPITWESASTENPWAVHFEPSLPYIYLPRNACDRLAKYLPVTFDSNLQLYLWDTKNSSNNYTKILTSPHFIDFVLHSASPDAVDTTISVALALLNLELTALILGSKTTKQYFPCRPLDTPSNTVVLGRAFLQAAYLAVNWENGMMAVGQAPGADHKTRADNATQGLRMIRGGQWDTFGVGKAALVNVTGDEETALVKSWSSVLTPLEGKKGDVKKGDGVGLEGGRWGLGMLLTGIVAVSML